MQIKAKRRAALWVSAFPEQRARMTASNIASAVKRPGLRSRTPARAKVETIYRREAKAWLALPENHKCAVMKYCLATQVHHIRGRRGSLLRDQSYWLAVSPAGHFWIHNHPVEARRLGMLCEEGKWNASDNSTNRPL